MLRPPTRPRVARLAPAYLITVSSPPQHILAGSKDGAFVIGSGTRVVFDKSNEVGSGGFSHVFRGHLKSGEPCAVKCVPPACRTLARAARRPRARSPLHPAADGVECCDSIPTLAPARPPARRARVINKKIFSKPEDRADMLAEVAIMQRLHGSQHIVAIHESIETSLPLDEANPGASARAAAGCRCSSEAARSTLPQHCSCSPPLPRSQAATLTSSSLCSSTPAVAT